MANVKDGATSLVAVAPSPATSGVSLTVTTGEGALFPIPPFYAISHPATSLPTVAIAEKVLVTAIVGDVLTIVRAQGIYSAKSIAIGWRISNAIFQEDMNNSSIIQNEVPGGTINGVTTAFTVASATGMLTGSLRVYKNGIRLKGGGADFTQTSTGFTMVTAPATGTVLLCDYNVNGAINNVGTNSLISDEVPAGLVNGSNATFTLARAYIAGSLEVYVNGLKQKRTTHFTETTPASGILTMGTAPLTGDVITCNYQFNLNPASNSDTVDGIHANATPTANQLLPLNSSALVPTAALGTTWTSYTPSWTGSTTNPAIGNGTITGLSSQSGKTVTVQIEIIAGSTTTFGSGRWAFSLPSGLPTTSNRYLGQGVGLRTGSAFLFGPASNVDLNFAITTTTLSIIQSGGVMGSGSAAWANGDIFSLEIQYQTP